MCCAIALEILQGNIVQEKLPRQRIPLPESLSWRLFALCYEPFTESSLLCEQMLVVSFLSFVMLVTLSAIMVF